MEVFERINGLLENFYNRDSTDILNSFFIHRFQCCHITFHKVGVIAAHHLFQEKYADRKRNQTADSKSPVKHKDQYDHRDRHDNCPGQIGKLMCQKVFSQSCIVINHLSQASARILTEIAKRQFYNMMHGCFFHICRCTECCQMGTAERNKI